MPSLFLAAPSLPSCALMNEWERSTGLDALSYLGVPDLDECEAALLRELIASAKADAETPFEPSAEDRAAIREEENPSWNFWIAYDEGAAPL